MKILLIDSTYPINTRNTKILNSLGHIFKNDTEIFALAWNRDDRPIHESEYIAFKIYSSAAEYGNPWAKFKKLIGYYSFIKKENRAIRPDILIASHWDMLLLCFFIKKRYQKLVYENLDMPTANSWLVLKILKLIENIALLKTDTIIFASRFFSDLYSGYTGPKFVLENLPFRSITDKTGVLNHNSDKLKVSFIGTVRYFEVMKLLIDASEELPVEILFWGEGPDTNKLKDYSKHLPSIKFFGKYDYRDIGDIYKCSDLIWAVYPSMDYNVKYAISNKFFESVVFKKPAVFASGTKLGDYVENNNLGFTVNPYSSADIRNLFKSLIRDNNMISRLNFSSDTLFWEQNELVLQKIMTDLYGE